MRSIIIGMGSLYLCIATFVICAMIQLNANISVEVSEAANEAAYLSMLSLTERDEISTDEQLEEEFVRNANLILRGSTRAEAEEHSVYFRQGE